MIPKLITFFDTETTGIDYKKDRVVELAWLVCNSSGKILLEDSRLIKPDGFTIPEEATKIHGITTEIANEAGEPLYRVLRDFFIDMGSTDLIIGHNVLYDIEMIKSECNRVGLDFTLFQEKPRFCTMKNSRNFCQIPRPDGAEGFKFPKLAESYEIFTGSPLINVHDALVDTEACKEVFFKGIERGFFRFNKNSSSMIAEVAR